MKNIAGYNFDNPKRHVYLHLYNPSANHDKVYHIVSEENDAGYMQVSAMWGRRGSSLRHMVKTKDRAKKPGFVPAASARAAFDNLLLEQLRGGYEVKTDERFSNGVPETKEIEIETLKESMVIWGPRQFAENPVRATGVNQSFNLAGYAIALLPEGKYVLTLVEKGKKKFFDQHGAEITIDQSLFNAVYDLEGDTIIDGVWDGDVYHVFDMPCDKPYSERVVDLSNYIDGTVDDHVVKMADIYLTAAEAQKAVSDARELGAQTILGIKMGDGERPGNKTGRKMLVLRPRAVLCTMSVDGGVATLGVDDGLGVIEVCKLASNELSAGDNVLVEYDSWSGHGTTLTNPEFVKKVNEPADCSIEQLLAV